MYNKGATIKSALGRNMRIWIACFLVLFAVVELYEWAKHLSLPVYILGGAVLAIASNYDKRPDWLFPEPHTKPTSSLELNFTSDRDCLSSNNSSDTLPQG